MTLLIRQMGSAKKSRKRETEADDYSISSVAPRANMQQQPTCQDAATPPSTALEPEVIELSSEIVVVPKLIARPGKHFPLYENGDVFIEIKGKKFKREYQLHSTILSLVSPWFQSTLAIPFRDIDDQVAERFTKLTGVVARYELHYDSILNIEVLSRTVSRLFDFESFLLLCSPSARFRQGRCITLWL